ncbi:MAG TPA: metal-sulfur cluster assembly factor [Tepiditoga sp.]|nr:metal-sulfur cluster assembly factor [Tepiditoga sp.]
MSVITKEEVMKALENVYDLEIGFDVVSLGLIYNVDIDNNNVHVNMTLTTPMCPLAGMMVQDATEKVSAIENIGDVKVDLIFDPPWEPSMAKEEVRRILGI